VGRRACAVAVRDEIWDAHETREPTLLLLLFGWMSLRKAARVLSGLFLKDPPRNTRRRVAGNPTARGRHFQDTTTVPEKKTAPVCRWRGNQ